MKLGKMRTPKEREREEQIRRCMEFIKHTGSIGAGQALARGHKFTADESTWITALARTLK